jgi:CHASE2 domain-containing sensor protein
MWPQIIKTVTDLRSKGWRYWARVMVIACSGVALSRWLADRPPAWMLEWQLQVYQALSTAGPHAPDIGHIRVVEITDEEFWKGELQGRRPLKRTYIAALLSQLCRDGAQAIALDIDMRSPLPDGTVLNHKDYQAETDHLAKTIQDVSQHCKVVLARTLNCPSPPNGKCTREPSVLDPYRFDPQQVTWGYINLNSDIRQVPLRRANVESGTLDSLAQATALADGGVRALQLQSPQQFPYGSFIPEATFSRSNAVFAARDVLLNRDARISSAIHGKTILVGGSWHAYAYGRGPLLDSFLSPAGTLPGVFLHANYAAAILDGRTYPPAGTVVTAACELIIVTAVAVVFALPTSWKRRWYRLLVMLLILTLLAYTLFQNLGIFLELTIPVLLLIGHALLDEYLKMRDELIQLRRRVAPRA